MDALIRMSDQVDLEQSGIPPVVIGGATLAVFCLLVFIVTRFNPNR